MRPVVAGTAAEAITEPTESTEKSALSGNLPSQQPAPALTQRELRCQASRTRRHSRCVEVQRLKQVRRSPRRASILSFGARVRAESAQARCPIVQPVVAARA